MLLPKGIDFDKAPAVIYVVVRYNHNKQPLSDFFPIPSRIERPARRMPRSAGSMILRALASRLLCVMFEAPRQEQSYELQAVTTDDDKDGNQFVVTITLSADSKAALEAAQPEYFAILTKY